MSRPFIKTVAARWMVIASLVLPTVSAADWPTIVPPPDSRVVWVGDDMQVNGVPMQIQQFSSRLLPEDVLAFYRDQWRDGRFPPVENRAGGWEIIGRQSGEYYETVQVRPSGGMGSEGFLGVSRLPSFDGVTRVDEAFPRLPDTQVITDMDSDDAGKLAKTLILQNGSSVHSNAAFYESQMARDGWTRIENFGDSNASAEGRAMYFQRANKACHIVINQKPKGTGSMIVVNIVSTGL